MSLSHKQKPGKNLNDPSAGSPTETLLRLLLPTNDKVHPTSLNLTAKVYWFHLNVPSVGATGGVYKGQGRNQGELMTHPY